MSTPPKEPKPDEARRGGPAPLESTYLGVAPTAPEPAAGATPAAGAAAVQGAAVQGAAVQGSAIIATPMISVSDRGKRGEAAPPQAVAPQPLVAAPARPTGLQGGWQSAGVPRALGPEQTALHGSPAWPMPPVVKPEAPQQQPAAPPSPAPQVPAARTVSPGPGAVAGLHQTALASDYLRGARDAALGAEAAPPAQRPAQPTQPGVADFGRQTAYSPLPVAPPQRPHWQEAPAVTPPAQLPVTDLNATAASGGPAAPPPGGPPPTLGPPPTAELSSPAPIPWYTGHQAPQLQHPEPERGASPRSMGTQASVAPPPGELGASFHGPMAPAIHDATPAAPGAPMAAQGAAGPSPLMAAAASPGRHVVPQALVGTMMDRTPSIPGHGLPQGSPPPPANPTLRFEQVPAPRSSLAQQASAFGLNLPIEHNNTTQWGRPAHDGKTKALPGRKAKTASQWRMVVLAALALLSVVFAAFGPELRELARAELERRGIGSHPRGVPLAAPADQATLTNLPSPGPGSPAGGVEPAAAAAPSAAPAAPPPVAGEATAAVAGGEAASTSGTAPAAMPALEAPPAAEPEPAAGKRKRGARGRDAKAQAEAAAAASAESTLAAEAGRHVLAARFADALPLYRNLQRDYPQNTVYAAMTRVLEQKLSGAQQNGAEP